MGEQPPDPLCSRRTRAPERGPLSPVTSLLSTRACAPLTSPLLTPLRSTGGVRGAAEPIAFVAEQPTVILMAGLQGVGKTTACGKLALYMKSKGRKVMMVATDVYRPAAIEQLQMLGQRVEVPVFEMGTSAKPEDIAAAGVAKAREGGFDTVIIDTAGRLTVRVVQPVSICRLRFPPTPRCGGHSHAASAHAHSLRPQIDEEMMTELKAVKASTGATETLLVVDAMTGQEAAALTDSFNKAVDITGAVLTKMDGDSRGGAALSVREVSGKPIKFMGTGEKLEALEAFFPERMTSRILGMGDIVSLVEKAQRAVKDEEAAEIQRRLMEAQFDFNDFLKQAEMVSGMGSMQQLMKMLPGMAGITDRQLEEAEKSFKSSKSLIQSMTAEERVKPELVAKSASRRRRIARGAGRSDTEMATLVDVFASMRSKMQDMGRLMRIAGGKVNQARCALSMSPLFSRSCVSPAGGGRRLTPRFRPQQMTAEEMSSMVGAKKRIHKGKVQKSAPPAHPSHVNSSLSPRLLPPLWLAPRPQCPAKMLSVLALTFCGCARVGCGYLPRVRCGATRRRTSAWWPRRRTRPRRWRPWRRVWWRRRWRNSRQRRKGLRRARGRRRSPPGLQTRWRGRAGSVADTPRGGGRGWQLGSGFAQVEVVLAFSKWDHLSTSCQIPPQARRTP